MPERMPLELYFSMDRSFERAWKGAVSLAADRLMAHQMSLELGGAELITEAGVSAEPPPEELDAMAFASMVPWPDRLIAGMDTVAATFSWYTAAEVQLRLDARRKGLCTVNRPHDAAECNGEHLSDSDT